MRPIKRSGKRIAIPPGLTASTLDCTFMYTDKDYYKTLGVAENASEDEIKKAFRKLAKENHPDKKPGDAAAEARFKEINEAHSVLTDKKKREQYDTFRKYGGGFGGFAGGGGGARSPYGGGGVQGVDLSDLFGGGGFRGTRRGGGGPAPGGVGEFEDLFGQFFGGGMGGMGGAGRARTRERTGPARGQDIRRNLSVPFDLAIHGGKASFTHTRRAACKSCKGSGAAGGAPKRSTCETCGGTGSVTVGGGSGFAFARPCPACAGSGERLDNPCKACSGSGVTLTNQSLDVDIPRGVAEGQTIRLKGLGHAGEQGAPTGDLLLTIHIQQSGQFERKGNDIHTTVHIDIADAALGLTRDIETINGHATLKIPPGTQPGAKLRLRGAGVEDAHGHRGDHIVTIDVTVPKHLTQAQREALEKYRKS